MAYTPFRSALDRQYLVNSLYIHTLIKLRAPDPMGSKKVDGRLPLAAAERQQLLTCLIRLAGMEDRSVLHSVSVCSRPHCVLCVLVCVQLHTVKSCSLVAA
jgi:hypothetical protein